MKGFRITHNTCNQVWLFTYNWFVIRMLIASGVLFVGGLAASVVELGLRTAGFLHTTGLPLGIMAIPFSIAGVVIAFCTTIGLLMVDS